MKCQLLFILSNAKLFIQFASLFQGEDSLIHLIHNEIKCLIITIIWHIFKEQAIKSFKCDLSKDPFENENLISPKDKELQKEIVQLSEKGKGYFLTDVRQHYVAFGTYL